MLVTKRHRMTVLLLTTLAFEGSSFSESQDRTEDPMAHYLEIVFLGSEVGGEVQNSDPAIYKDELL